MQRLLLADRYGPTVTIVTCGEVRMQRLLRPGIIGSCVILATIHMIWLTEQFWKNGTCERGRQVVWGGVSVCGGDTLNHVRSVVGTISS